MASAKEVFVTDWERDGVFDLLVQWTDGRVTLHAGAVAGGFLPAVTLGQSGWAGMTLALGGWCANNRLPQLVALDGSGNLWLYPNRGKGDLVTRTLMASGVSANRLAMVDYDGDGFQDLLARQTDGNVRLYRGSGAPAPRAETRSGGGQRMDGRHGDPSAAGCHGPELDGAGPPARRRRGAVLGPQHRCAVLAVVHPGRVGGATPGAVADAAAGAVAAGGWYPVAIAPSAGLPGLT